MSTVSLEIFLRWWIRELLNALLRPMFLRYREQQREGSARLAEIYEERFFRLLNACDCYPFCVQVDPCGMWITDEPEYHDEDVYFAEDQAR